MLQIMFDLNTQADHLSVRIKWACHEPHDVRNVTEKWKQNGVQILKLSVLSVYRDSKSPVLTAMFDWAFRIIWAIFFGVALT